MKQTKYYMVAFALLLTIFSITIGDGKPRWIAVAVNAVIPAEPIAAVPSPVGIPTFPPRTIKTVKWTQTICSNEATKQDHTMHLISREEISDAVIKAGFVGEAQNIMVALAYAEGQADLACESDWDLANNTWGGSIGLWQVRSLKAETGTGSCRDIEALRSLDINFQARCAWEISGNGKNNFRPWAAYTRGLYKKYL